MESIPQDTFLKFNPDTMKEMRKEYNLDKPGQIDEVINLLQDWVAKQNHFTKKTFPRHFLERAIMLNKGSVERAKTQLEKLFTMRTLVPKYFENYDPKGNYADLDGSFYATFLPKLTKENYRVFTSQVTNVENIKNDLAMYKVFILSLEYMRAYDYSNGYVFLFDLRQVNVAEFTTKLDLVYTRQTVMLFTEGYQTRVKGIHYITSSKTIEFLLNMLRPLFSKKIRDRFFVHANIESVYEHVPKDILPVDMGGEEKSVKELCSEWAENLASEEKKTYLTELFEARTDESLRLTSKFNDEYMGTAGSFRLLRLD